MVKIIIKMAKGKKQLVSVNIDSDTLINIKVLCKVSSLDNPQLHYRNAIKQYAERELQLYPPEKVRILQNLERI